MRRERGFTLLEILVALAIFALMAAAAIMPPFSINDGFTPKKAGFQITKSASLPFSMEPTSCEIPWAMAGLIAYLAI